MQIELINTGSELLLGRVLNTHQQWIGKKLADAGYILSSQVTVPDTAESICDAVQKALGRADLVITTGGLGPTSDDITRERISAQFNKPLQKNEEIVEHITSFFAQRKRPMPESVLVQALVPEGALVFQNKYGTAPGLAMSIPSERSNIGNSQPWLVMLPGPPRELRPMVETYLLPFIQQQFPLKEEFHCRTLRSTGIGESMVEDLLLENLRPLMEQGLDLGFCARTGQVDIRLCGHGSEILELIAKAESLIRREIGKYIYGVNDDSIEKSVVDKLIANAQTIAVAESCTGGFLGHHITSIPGSSRVFLGGFLTYSNELKEKMLGVQSETLAKKGAVSKEVSIEMAEAARLKSNADHAISITGIAGPGGGTKDKPVGTVWLGLASNGYRPLAIRKFHPYDRETFKQATVNQALELIRRRLVEDE